MFSLSNMRKFWKGGLNLSKNSLARCAGSNKGGALVHNPTNPRM